MALSSGELWSRIGSFVVDMEARAEEHNMTSSKKLSPGILIAADTELELKNVRV